MCVGNERVWQMPQFSCENQRTTFGNWLSPPNVETWDQTQVRFTDQQEILQMKEWMLSLRSYLTTSFSPCPRKETEVKML